MKSTSNNVIGGRLIDDIVMAVEPNHVAGEPWKYRQANVERGEWSYKVNLKRMIDEGKIDKTYLKDIQNTYTHQLNTILDRRFTDGHVSVLIEFKNNFDESGMEAAIEQLRNYVKLEKLTAGIENIIAILANLDDDRIMVWKNDVADYCRLRDERFIRSFEEYKSIYCDRQNDPYRVERCAYELNDMLESLGVYAKCRADLVTGCVRALNYYSEYDFPFNLLQANTILSNIRDCIDDIVKDNLNSAEQMRVLKKIYSHPTVVRLTTSQWREILNKLTKDLLPYVNDKTCEGQDILNIFYTVFNKYVGRDDKNQAFTPSHLVHTICKVAGIDKNSRILDPTCGSGSFLIRALAEGVKDCDSAAEVENFKRNHIYGIESEEGAWGLALSNMMRHDNVKGCDNIIMKNCFDVSKETIQKWDINTIIMNPPFNAQRQSCWKELAIKRGWYDDEKKEWLVGGEDPTKGFQFAYWAAEMVGKGTLVVILPMACAIADKKNKEMHYIKQKMLEKHTLKAVFSLPNEIFLPGATICSCCMVFELGKRHKPDTTTFFGYYKNDGFGMKKHLGRVEKKTGTWDEIEKKWLSLFNEKEAESGLSCKACVDAGDEWCPEAYMETDYKQLTDADFEQSIRDFIGFNIMNGNKF